jgi:hypothetical protein
MSIFCRQRIVVLGWTIEYGDRTEDVWLTPLDPLSTQYIPIEHNDYLVGKSDFENLVTGALKEFSLMDPLAKEYFRDFTIGLVPFVEMQTSQRFLSMFHALEGCRKSGGGLPPDLEVNESDVLLKDALERAKVGVDPSIGERIDGLIERIDKTSLRKELGFVLKSWSISTSGLWPLFGTKSNAGLIEIRNKLSHSTPKNVTSLGLVVATWHLSILIERILLTLLKIPIENTSAGVGQYRRDEWEDPVFLSEQRKQVITG